MVKSEEGRTFPFNRVARGRGVCVSVPGNLYMYAPPPVILVLEYGAVL